MFGIGTGELLLLLVIALLVLGPERMPKLARDLGKTMGDLRRTSDELRTEFLEADRTLSADRLLDVAARQADAAAPAEAQPSAPPDVGATQAEAATGPDVEPTARSGSEAARTSGAQEASAAEVAAAPEPEETEFDREARLARERLEDPELSKERADRARAEGWKIPTDEAGSGDRWG